ncbi:MAG: sugar transferase [Bacilli bacterium]|nr:sugar transferase [Bacilli bacterium]MBO6195540.1 sugar transferase [Bacilli bacterium]
MYKYVKRGLDLTIALIMLLVLLIPMIIIAICIKLEDKGPALFKQERTGKDGKNFKLMKFRSMKVNNDVRDFSKGDQYTKVGKFIRKTSLDELPQIFNIIKGEMSFIGPRPWIPEYFEYMNETQRGRVKVLPGMTGLAQASGRNGISIFQKISYDLQYVKNFSFKQDIYIVFKTIYVVLKKESVDIGKLGIKSEIEDLKTQEKLA